MIKKQVVPIKRQQRLFKTLLDHNLKSVRLIKIGSEDAVYDCILGRLNQYDDSTKNYFYSFVRNDLSLTKRNWTIGVYVPHMYPGVTKRSYKLKVIGLEGATVLEVNRVVRESFGNVNHVIIAVPAKIDFHSKVKENEAVLREVGFIE